MKNKVGPELGNGDLLYHHHSKKKRHDSPRHQRPQDISEVLPMQSGGMSLENDAILAALTEKSPDYIWVLDTDCRVVVMNSAFKKAFSGVFHCEPQIGINVMDLMTKDRRNYWLGVHKRAMTGEQFSVELHLDISGVPLDIEVSVQPVIDETATIAAVSFFGHDITAWKKAQQALKESEEQFQLAIEGSNGGLWDMKLVPGSSLDLLSDDMFLSPGLKGFLGFEDDEFPNSIGAWQSRILPEGVTLLRKSAQDHFEGRTDLHEVEYPIRHKDGSVRWIYSRGKIQRDAQGMPIRWTGIDWDITERKQIEEALRLQKDLVHKYLDIAGVMFVALNSKGIITLVNKRTSEILGYEEEELIGKNWFDTCVPERMRDKVHQVFDQLMAGEIEPLEYYENPVITRESEERIIAWHNTLLRDDLEKIIGTLSSGEDVTESKRAEQALKESEERFRIASESASDLIWEWDIIGGELAYATTGR